MELNKGRMESSPSIETVCQAIHALYHNPDAGGKERASVWLGELQRSVHAWKVADELLQRRLDVESCYFAAQTMRTKIQYAFHELPESAHESLRDSLLVHIGNITQETSQVIITQLCLALADLALQMASWKSSVQDLIMRFGENAQQIPSLLEVLTVLPEEINSRSLRLGANRRNDIVEQFNLGAPFVLQLLVQCMDCFKSDPRALIRVMRCLGSWFNIGVIPSSESAHNKLLVNVFQALINPQTPSIVHEAATDCVCSALMLIEDIHKYPSLIQTLYQGVLTLPESYHLSVAEEDIDKSINYCRIFTELVEALLEVVVNLPGQGFGDLRVLDLLLTCIGHHDYEVAEITFNCWYRLSEYLYKKNSELLNELFRSYIERLITGLCKHCQLEPDHEGNPEESDDFSDFRSRVSELLRDVVFLVGSDNCFRQMFNNLRSQSSSSSWEISEASLYVMSSVAKNILPDENEVVPQVVDAILNLPDNVHISVKYTSIQLIGELCEWIEKHSSYLEAVLQFLLLNIQNKKLSSVSANALQSICSTCRDQMGAHFPGLLQIIRAMDNFNISNDAAVGLLRGAALVLVKMNTAQLVEGLSQLCLIQMQPLSQILRGVDEMGDHVKKDPIIWLDRLAAIFRLLVFDRDRQVNSFVTNGQAHPCQALVQQQIWPLLSETCTKYQNDIRVIERCCRCIRFTIRCLGKHSAPLLEPLVKQMVELYQVHQHSCFLYLGSILVDEYGTEAGCTQGLLDMLYAFCRPTFRLLEEANGLRNHPDIVDDLFRLCTRFIQRAPMLLLTCAAMKSIMECALYACTIDHRDAHSSVMKFILDLLKCASAKEDAEDYKVRREIVFQLISEHGQLLVTNMVHSCVFCLPSAIVPDVAEVIYELMQLDRPSVCRWLESTLKSLPNRATAGTVTATQKQLYDFHRDVTSAEEEKTIKNAMRDFIRLFR
ncbi:Transportin-3 [Chamberlinius hualienensis]